MAIKLGTLRKIVGVGAKEFTFDSADLLATVETFTTIHMSNIVARLETLGQRCPRDYSLAGTTIEVDIEADSDD